MDTVLTTTDTSADNTANPDIYVIAAHPAWRESRVNRPLMEAAKALPRVQVQDLYSSYPDYAIDVPKEQAALERAQLVVLLHPMHWYSMPALQKLWLDDVLTYGWAYGEGEEEGTKGRALQGKDLWLVATTGGPETSYHPQGYNRYFFDAFLPPYEQSAALCGMRFLPPLVLHGAHSVDRQTVAGHIETFRQRLQSYPDWPELEDLEQCAACVVPMKDRPLPEAAADSPNGHAARLAAGSPQGRAAPSGGSELHAVSERGGPDLSAGPPQGKLAPIESDRGSATPKAHGVKSVGAA